MQRDLFRSDPYQGFSEGMPSDYPKHAAKRLHPLFIGRKTVHAGRLNKREYTVDLDINECTCQKGWAWLKSAKGKWYEAPYCTHKLSLLSSIVDKLDGPDRNATERAYLRALSTRYNQWEVVSAFHKELRRGDVDRAYFWGLMLSTTRGIRGVIQYMLNIIYEETRDHELASELIKWRKNQRAHNLDTMFKAIGLFCATPKKWELSRRFEVFQSEMRGYNLLAKAYSPDVARAGNIIPSSQKPKLLKALIKGAQANDMIEFQRGLKGLQKLQYADEHTDDALNEHRYWLYEQLYDLADGMFDGDHDVWHVISVVNERAVAGYGIGYHELNAIGDAIMGEPYQSGILSPAKRRAAATRPLPPIPLGVWPLVPLYANDNHTYGGKALMRRYPEQLKPGSPQIDLDFRWCGAYFGVCYRMLAYRQHKNCDVPWETVTWDRELYRIVDMLWY